MAENGNNSIRDRFSAQLGRHARSRAKKAEKAADPATLKSQLKDKDQEISELRAQLLRNSQANTLHSLRRMPGCGGCRVFASFRIVSEFIIHGQQLPLSLSPSMSTHFTLTPLPKLGSETLSERLRHRLSNSARHSTALDPDIMDLTFAEIAEVTPSCSVRKRGKARWRELFPEAWEFKDLSSP
ncbi:hypothetical protein GGX14DRAFT_575271 [Mycena pura]|uniref:Uncharacterized protein n=1 Tax=Mycena pura TaxID=153505 RepID=A0AAD6UWA3_9AGAR|nr:hypothetical protein GGX14DRAFT_575271 [Mycena pura]